MAPSILHELTIPEETKKITEWAFDNTQNFPSCLIYQAQNCEEVFWGNLRESVDSIVIGATTRKLIDNLFNGFTKLNNVDNQSKRLSVGKNVFSNTPWIDRDDLWENGLLYLGTCLLKAQESLSGKCYVRNDITSIASYAFANCKNLTTISLSNEITYIGEGAFISCSKLKTIKLSCNIESIDKSTFEECILLSEIAIPDNVSLIDDRAFFNCTSLGNIDLPSKIIQIGKDAFANCTSFTSISLPLNCTVISSDAFDGCENIRSITCGLGSLIGFNSIAQHIEHVNLIGSNSVEQYTDSYHTTPNFAKFAKLKSVVIIQNIQVTDYYSKDSWSNWQVRATPFFKYQKGSNWNNQDGKYDFDIRKNIESISFHKTDFIPPYICNGMENLTSVTICSNVHSIGIHAFENCKALTNVIIPEGVEIIDDYAFRNCENLTNISLPSSIKRIGCNAFAGCKALTSIIIPNGTETIDNYAFYQCENLANIILPNSTKRVGNALHPES